jgi:hypothetical protein
MRLRYTHHPSNPISSIDDFLKRRLESSQKRDWTDFDKSLPSVLISRCPYCDNEIWMKAGLMFSLTDNFWFRGYSDGREDVVEKESVCKHLFCVDGALNLNGNPPAEAHKWADSNLGENWDHIWVASEVPFVKPRVLGSFKMVAVIHDFPVAGGKYTAYPVVYFTDSQPRHEDFCIAWATKAFVSNFGSHGYTMNGVRVDAQDYDLAAWVAKQRLYWLSPHSEEHPLANRLTEECPYLDLPGRQHPYEIVEGQVIDLPYRDRDEEPCITISD